MKPSAITSAEPTKGAAASPLRLNLSRVGRSAGALQMAIRHVAARNSALIGGNRSGEVSPDRGTRNSDFRFRSAPLVPGNWESYRWASYFNPSSVSRCSEPLILSKRALTLNYQVGGVVPLWFPKPTR